MAHGEVVQPQRKALELNLDDSIYGSFSEIGAGQEVARLFFLVGAASGTVAKTVCAYDKNVSDSIYGAGGRYVSRPRLEAMLESEWSDLHAQVSAERRASSRLFAFADTASARNYAGTNLSHAWVGIRFQQQPGGDWSQAVLHVNLRDETARAQQETLGILGVNLTHAVFHSLESIEQFLDCLSSELDLHRLEVDALDLQGDAFAELDSQRAQVALATRGLTPLVLLPREGRTEPPAEELYKRPVVLLPGTFQEAEPIHARAAAVASDTLRSESDARGTEPSQLFALSLELASTIDEVLERVRALHALGADVALFHDRELFRMAAIIDRYTKLPIRFGVSTKVVLRVLEETQYEGLEGRLLEALAALFIRNVRLYVFPSRSAELSDSMRRQLEECGNGLVTLSQIQPPGASKHLYEYLVNAGFLIPLDSVEDAEQ